MNVETYIIAAIIVSNNVIDPNPAVKIKLLSKNGTYAKDDKVHESMDKCSKVGKDWYVDWSQMNKQKIMHQKGALNFST